MRTYFSPSEEVQQIYQNLNSKYKLENLDYGCLYYRGTDKINETKPINYDKYVNIANAIYEIEGFEYPLIIQSDQKEFIAHIKESLPEANLLIVDELQSISGAKGYHYTLSTESMNQKITPYHHAIHMQAVTKIMANSKYYIANNSNVSLWTVLNSLKTQELIQLSSTAKNLSYFRKKSIECRRKSLKDVLISQTLA